MTKNRNAPAQAPAQEEVVKPAAAPVADEATTTETAGATAAAVEDGAVAGAETVPTVGEYYAVHGGPMIDPDSGVAYTGAPTQGPLTSWLQCQIDADKIKAVE